MIFVNKNSFTLPLLPLQKGKQAPKDGIAEKDRVLVRLSWVKRFKLENAKIDVASILEQRFYWKYSLFRCRIWQTE